MQSPSEWDTATQVVVGTVSTPALVYIVQKALTFWKTEGSSRTGVSATDAQFASLRNQIKAQDERIAQQDARISMLLVEMQRQDGVIHRQQTKLTRTEMLVRQLVGLVNEKSVTVPTYIQEELDDLINANNRPLDAKTRASDAT